MARMDRSVRRFRKIEPGARFAAAWKSALIVRDLGGSASAEPAASTP